MILGDTNILIEFYKNNPQIVQELRQIGQNQLAISPVTQAELYFGALNKAELGKIKQHLSLMKPLKLLFSAFSDSMRGGGRAGAGREATKQLNHDGGIPFVCE